MRGAQQFLHIGIAQQIGKVFVDGFKGEMRLCKTAGHAAGNVFVQHFGFEAVDLFVQHGARGNFALPLQRGGQRCVQGADAQAVCAVLTQGAGGACGKGGIPAAQRHAQHHNGAGGGLLAVNGDMPRGGVLPHFFQHQCADGFLAADGFFRARAGPQNIFRQQGECAFPVTLLQIAQIKKANEVCGGSSRHGASL